jgi:hypothetical protein
LQAVQRPATERQVQALGVGQGGGEDLGTLRGRVGVGTPRAGPLLQAVESVLVEAPDPGVDGGAGAVEGLGDGPGPLPLGGGLEDPGTLDQASGGGACLGQLGEGLRFLGGQLAEWDSGSHGCTSLGGTPSARCKSLAGCTTKPSDQTLVAGRGRVAGVVGFQKGLGSSPSSAAGASGGAVGAVLAG